MTKYTSIENFHSFDIYIGLEKIQKSQAKKTAKYLKKNSPRGNRKKDYYSSSWKSKYDAPSLTATVYNKKNYRLTHLLENGHFIVNKVGSVGWAAPRPHIEKAYDIAKKQYYKAMEKAEIKIDIK